VVRAVRTRSCMRVSFVSRILDTRSVKDRGLRVKNA
jgi:hypothetical protein